MNQNVAVLAAQELRRRRQGRTSMEAFTLYTKPDYEVNWHHRVMLQALDRFVAGDIRRLMIFMQPRAGKPLFDGSMILTETGKRVRISDIHIGERVITHRGVSKPVVAIDEQGDLPCLRITTVCGRNVIAASDHPFLTPEGWIKAGDLRTGMALGNVSMPLTVATQEHRSLAEFRLAGYFVGDGNCTGHPSQKRGFMARVCAAEQEIIDDLKVCANEMGFGISEKKPHPQGWKTTKANSYHFTDGVRPWLKDAGLAFCSSHTKRVPWWVFQGTSQQIGAFLGTYFSCDGTVSRRGASKGKKPRDDVYVELYSVHRELLRDVQHLLLRVGVQSAIRPKNGRYQGAVHKSWRLILTSLDNVNAFKKSVPLYGEKRLRIASWSAYQCEFPSSLLTDKIASIEEVGPKPCRCITVSDDHTYTADDFVVHNSEIASLRLPAYCLGRNPDAAVIACSYSAALASRNNRSVQRIIDAPEYGRLFPDTRLFGKNIRTVATGTWLRNSENFEVVGHRGVYRSAGVGGGITGFGFNIGIIDDVLKSAAEANSPTIREKIWEWYNTAFYTRQAKNAGILIMMTRWHDDDLAGRLLRLAREDPAADQWTVISFPAIAEKDVMSPDPRCPGEPLWPNRFNVEFMAKTRAQLSAYEWSAVYQQNPRSQSGGLFKSESFRYFTEGREEGQPWVLRLRAPDGTVKQVLAEECRWFQTVDCAMKTNQTNDWTVVGTFLLTPDKDLVIYDICRVRIEMPRQYGFMVEQRLRYPQLMFQAIEDKVSGTGVLQQGALEGMPFRPLHASGDKVQRAAAVAVMYENGKVYHRQGASWLTAYESEVLDFPVGAYDDQVDVVAYAGILVQTDALLSAGVNRDLLCYPEPAEPAQQLPLTAMSPGQELERLFQDERWWDN